MKFVSALRYVLLVPAVLVSGWLFLLHWQIVRDPFCDAGCRDIVEWPLSRWVALIALAGSVALLWSLIKGDRRMFSRLAGLGALVAVGLFGVGAALGGWCPWCQALTFLIVAVALTAVKPEWLGATLGTPAAALALFVAVGLAVDRGPKSLPVIPLRPYEVSVGQGMYDLVVFSDPECPECRRLMRFVDDVVEPNYPTRRVRHRWRLLTASGARGIRTAMCIEAVCLTDAKAGACFRGAVYAQDKPLTDDLLLQVAKNAGVAPTVKRALDAPPSAALRLIAEDGNLAEEIGIRSVPFVLDCTGSHTVLAGPSTLYDLGNPGEYKARSTREKEAR